MQPRRTLQVHSADLSVALQYVLCFLNSLQQAAGLDRSESQRCPGVPDRVEAATLHSLPGNNTIYKCGAPEEFRGSWLDMAKILGPLWCQGRVSGRSAFAVDLII